MQVRSINSIYNTGHFFNISNGRKTRFISSSGDIVSFSAKKYDSDSIKNPTNHCAYCGCKVYNMQQIDSIAKEILASKANRLEGKVKSVLEKLEGAKYSQEIALAKRMENEEQIKFFKDLLDAASKKSYLRGEEIFLQVYNIDKDSALETVTKNLEPLKRTIDHVSPQREDEENKDSDINLVEACYCCNHDLKKGSSFDEFYTMFPSIKNNMPKDKFEYAVSHLVSSSSGNIQQRLSASNLLKMLERLFIQKTETENSLASVNFRIRNCKSSITDAIAACQEEIRGIQSEISQLETQMQELKLDPEFNAMITRINYQTQADTLKTAISSLRDRRSRVSTSINELRNPPKSASNKKKGQISEEEKKQKIEDLKNILFSLEEQISQKETQLNEIQLKIEKLNQDFPPIEILEKRKAHAEAILNAYSQLMESKVLLSEKKAAENNYGAKKQALEERLKILPETSINLDDYSEEEKLCLNRYKELAEALSFIEEHPNGGAIRGFINKIAQEQMQKESLELQKNPIIIRYLQDPERESIKKELSDTKKQITDIEKQISDIEAKIKQLEKQISGMSKDEAEQELQINTESIRKLTEKQNDIKIPQRLSTLKAEIILVQSTIDDLTRKQNEISII